MEKTYLLNEFKEKSFSQQKNNLSIKDVITSSAMHELIQRYGEAGRQFLIGLIGVDQTTGQVFDRSLLKVSTGKLNPNYRDQNIKQQAGYAAEINSVSRRNAEAIINREPNRYARSEDIARYGKNHKVVDIIELVNGEARSTSQMKFVTDGEVLLKKIARGEGGGKTDLSRYLDADRLEVPTEQVENMKEFCRKKAKALKEQAERLQLEDKSKLAERLHKQSDNYKKLEEKITDSGLTTEEAIQYRLNPRWETTKDIASVSHRAGVEGARFGAAIGGTISLVSNIIAVHAGEKELSDAILDTTKNTVISGAVGYSAAFSGSALKSFMQQSSSAVTRGLSKTGLPAMIVSTCLAAVQSIKKYAKGEINEEELAHEVGLTTSGMLSASMFTTVGQFAIPIPVLGAIIGGMVGYTLTNTFYQSFFEVLKEAKLSAEHRKIIEMQCLAARIVAQEYEEAIKNLFNQKLIDINQESKAMFAVLGNPEISADDFCAGMNQFANMLGKKISINNMAELDDAMSSNNPLSI